MSTEMTQSLRGSVNEIADILINGISDDAVDSETVDTLVSGDDDTPTGDSNEVDEVSEGEDGEQEAQNEEEMTWSKALGVDDSKLVVDTEGNLKGVNVTIDGVTSQVDMKTLIDGYQFNARNTQVSQHLADERRQFEQIRNTAAETYTNKLTEINRISEYLGNKLMGEFQNVDWQTLRARDPAEYAARMQDYNFRNQEIQQLRSSINNELAQESAQQAQFNQQQMQQFLQNQLSILVNKNPEWSDSSKMRMAFDDMAGFANSTYGISPDEFGQVQDARYIEILKDAMAYRKGTQIAAKKLDKPLPKFVKSSGTSVQKLSRVEMLTKAAKNATGHSAKKLQRAAIAELLMQNST